MAGIISCSHRRKKRTGVSLFTRFPNDFGFGHFHEEISSLYSTPLSLFCFYLSLPSPRERLEHHAEEIAKNTEDIFDHHHHYHSHRRGRVHIAGLHSGKTLDLVYTVGVNIETLSEELFSKPWVRNTGHKSALPQQLGKNNPRFCDSTIIHRARFEESVENSKVKTSIFWVKGQKILEEAPSSPQNRKRRLEPAFPHHSRVVLRQEHIFCIIIEKKNNSDERKKEQILIFSSF